MKIKRNEYGEFFFSGFECDTSYVWCHNCNDKIMLDSGYLHIIEKLRDANLLEKDYEYACCNCYELIEVHGTTKCDKCGHLLDFEFTFENKMRVYCSNCNFEAEYEK